MELRSAVEDILLGASLGQIAAEYRQELIESFSFRDDEVTSETFSEETAAFMRKVARRLGDRHAGDARVLRPLHDWVLQVDHYEAWDALMSGFEFPGKQAVMRRGKVLFPGTLTAHWSEEDL